jgi:DNA-binding response OmpR family regulator
MIARLRAALAAKVPAAPTDEKPVLKPEEQRVIFQGKSCDLTPAGVEMLKILFAAKGKWVGGKTIGFEAHKTRARVDKSAPGLIESHQDYGYRIPSLLPQ